jgi:hypothetical protein
MQGLYLLVVLQPGEVVGDASGPRMVGTVGSHKDAQRQLEIVVGAVQVTRDTADTALEGTTRWGLRRSPRSSAGCSMSLRQRPLRPDCVRSGLVRVHVRSASSSNSPHLNS